ncbi:efflux RND transporter permease subunit [Humisphaera borealis]|uniref:MMPL family transporter n=1 Tax=Humisphaera borealis TaxID=2807512 RepID=A0A7M2WRE9_9BACT|nr:MMPL family transporter [Humisphaera borealis]QOV88107.1 MMPL family transporter [Humisphaera borealis]
MPDSAQNSRLARLVERVLTFPARRPWLALLISGLLTAIAIAGIFRLKANTSLSALFPRGNPSADALVRVLDAYPASGELILLASMAEGQDAAPEKLLAFAERFSQAVANSPDARQITAGVAYAPDPAFRTFIEQVLVPSGLYYLDDEAFARARQRLTAGEIRDQIRQNESLISQPGPAAGAAAKQLLKDPLRLHEFVKERFGSQRQFATWQGREEFISPDGRAILIRVTGTQTSSDLDYCEKMMKTLPAVAKVANTDGLTIDYIGAYAAADHSHQTIRADSIENVFASVILLQLLFIIFYRRPIRQFLLEIVPVLLGVAIGFGVYGWVRPSISPIAAVVGGILAGMGVDHSVMYLASYFRHLRDGCSPAEAVRRTAMTTVGALFVAWLTTIIGFVAIAFSSVRTLQEFALLGSFGLLCAFVAIVFILPAVLTLWDTRRLARHDTPETRRLPFRFPIEGVLAAIDRRRIALIAISLAVLAASAIYAGTRPGGVLPLESDLHVMHPQPNPPLAAEKKLAERFGSSPGGLLVHLRASSPDALLSLAHEVDRRLSSPAVRSAGVTGTFGLGTLLPDPATVARRRGVVTPAEIDRVIADFKAAIEDSPFDPKQYEGYTEFLRMALSQEKSPSLDDLRRFPALSRSLLPAESIAVGSPANEAIAMVFIDRPTDSRDRREALVTATRQSLAGLNGVTLTGLPVISMDTEVAIQRDLPLLLSISSGLCVLYMLFHYRSVTNTLLALLPTIFSLIVLAAAARWLDLRLNLINLIALPMLIGIDVDYGIYLVSLADYRWKKRQGGAPADPPQPPLLVRIAGSSQAVLVCAVSSGLGFLSLITVSVPAVQSLGLAVAIGVGSCIFGTFCLLAPILMVIERVRAR